MDVVVGGTSYELSTNFRVNSGTDNSGVDGIPVGGSARAMTAPLGAIPVVGIFLVHPIRPFVITA